MSQTDYSLPHQTRTSLMKEGFLQCLLDIAEGTDMYVRTLCRYYFTEIVVTVVWYLVLKYYLKRKMVLLSKPKCFHLENMMKECIRTG